jgi:hypothetical protein
MKDKPTYTSRSLFCLFSKLSFTLFHNLSTVRNCFCSGLQHGIYVSRKKISKRQWTFTNVRKQYRQWTCPQAIINYTKYMGGVDISDQKREYYVVGRSSKKWWKFIFHFVINVCVLNSFILYDLNNHPPLTAHGNWQLTFRRIFVLQLIG